MEPTPENNDEEARVLLIETNSRRPPYGYYNVRATLDAVEEVLR
jgi:hypothetical protein